jgi:hypothetical protein
MRAALIAIALIAACPAIVLAQGLSDCTCNDIREMRDRWCSARAAREEYKRIEDYLEGESNKTTPRQTRMFSIADKLMINQTCVQEAINSVSDKGVLKATAETKENNPIQSLFGMDDCRIVVTTKGESTACLKQIAEAHEGVHRAACLVRKAIKKDGSLVLDEELKKLDRFGKLGWYLGDTKFLLTSAQFASEEASGYGREMQLVKAKWGELQKNCKSQDFEAELENPDIAGQKLWDDTKPNSNDKRIYKLYDLTEDPCPSRPRPTPSKCTMPPPP